MDFRKSGGDDDRTHSDAVCDVGPKVKKQYRIQGASETHAYRTLQKNLRLVIEVECVATLDGRSTTLDWRNTRSLFL